MLQGVPTASLQLFEVSLRTCLGKTESRIDLTCLRKTSAQRNTTDHRSPNIAFKHLVYSRSHVERSQRYVDSKDVRVPTKRVTNAA
jgi:hypothetical protein